MEEIINTVESIFGKDVKIVECQTSSSRQQEELLLINGNPIKLDGIPNDDVKAIKSALLDGQIPGVKHLNQLLLHAGITQQPVQVETDLTVRSSLTTTEKILVSRNGCVLNDHIIKTEEDFDHYSQEIEIWQPLKRSKSSDNSNILKLSEASNSIITSTAERNKVPRNLDVLSTSTASALNDLPLANITTIKEAVISKSEQMFDSNSKTISLGDLSNKNSNDCDSGNDGFLYNASLATPWSQCPQKSIPKSPSASKDTKATSNCVSQEHCTLDNLLELLLSENSEEIQLLIILCVRLVELPYQFLKLISHKIHNDYSQSITLRLAHLLELWLKTCPNDFRNKTFMQELHIITDKCIWLHGNNFKEISQLLLHVPHILEQLDMQSKEYKEFLIPKSVPSSNSINRQIGFKSLKRFAMTNSKKENILSIAVSARELARQLTLIEHYYLKLITPEELLDVLNTDDLKHTLLKDAKSQSLLNWPSRSNIEYYVNWFYRLSYLIATEIVNLKKKSQSRIEMVEFWIETANECFNIGNFNSLMAILTGFNLTALSRLKKMWSKVKSTKLPGLENVMDTASNFSSYRSILKDAASRSKQEGAKEDETVIIPFFTLFLKDFILLHESSSSKVSCKHINLEEFLQLGSQLSKFSNFLRASCPYTHNSKTITYIQSAQVFNEVELLLFSFACEPPDNITEKMQLKLLKTGQK